MSDRSQGVEAQPLTEETGETQGLQDLRVGMCNVLQITGCGCPMFYRPQGCGCVTSYLSIHLDLGPMGIHFSLKLSFVSLILMSNVYFHLIEIELKSITYY